MLHTPIPAPAEQVHRHPLRLYANPRFGAPVECVEPYRGWTLIAFEEDDADGFTTTGYLARSDRHDVLLQVCRFGFHPTQMRFAWLVDNQAAAHRPGLLRRANGGYGPATDDLIDAALSEQVAA